MYIVLLAALFAAAYAIQLLLCSRAKNIHIKLLGIYLDAVLLYAALLLYLGFFGTMSMGFIGGGEIFLALVILIAVLGMLFGELLAWGTYLIWKRCRK